jgi:uncharacterized protein (DUF169 family)
VNNASIASRFETTFSLSRPPIGVTWVDEPPDDVETIDRPVPSACAFWTLAEKDVFYAPDAAHANCPVGAMTMGFELTEQTETNLMAIVAKMISDGYLGSEEPPAIPKMESTAKGVLYGPLAKLPLSPDAVLMWLTPATTMLFNEASGDASWIDTARHGALGRPTCGALPRAINGEHPATSLGCTGMRIFTGVPDHLLLAVVPGQLLDSFLERLDATLMANAAMKEFYDGHRAQFMNT